jgi:hypothetical protein
MCGIIPSFNSSHFTLKANVSLKKEMFTVDEAFEVFAAVAMNNAVFWDVSPCGSWDNRHFGSYKIHTAQNPVDVSQNVS